MPKVSVIVPVYNMEKYLSRCLTSLINQTIDNLEIIVVNDGSTDKSDEIIKEYKKANNNIRYVTKENGGLSSARNFGLLYATGEYIAFLDSDDLLALHCIESCMQIVEREKDIDLVWHDFYSIDENGKKIDIYNVCDKTYYPYTGSPHKYYYNDLKSNNESVVRSYDGLSYNCVQVSMEILLKGDFNEDNNIYKKRIINRKI